MFNILTEFIVDNSIGLYNSAILYYNILKSYWYIIIAAIIIYTYILNEFENRWGYSSKWRKLKNDNGNGRPNR